MRRGDDSYDAISHLYSVSFLSPSLGSLSSRGAGSLLLNVVIQFHDGRGSPARERNWGRSIFIFKIVEVLLRRMTVRGRKR